MITFLLLAVNTNPRHSLHNQAVSEQHRNSNYGNGGYQTQNQYDNNPIRRRPDLSRFDEREERDYR